MPWNPLSTGWLAYIVCSVILSASRTRAALNPVTGEKAMAVNSRSPSRSLLVPVATIILIATLRSQAEDSIPVPADVQVRRAKILSEGVRMAAEVYSPKSLERKKLPTIVMSHGWGGTAEHLRPDAIAFAQAGYLVVSFDYRGWGASEARIVPVSKPREIDGKLVAEVVEVRGVVDPIDQTTDILNVLHWVQGEALCDKDLLGIWGSSFSGGHVVYVAARDPRVKAFVSQVGSMDARWAIQNPKLREHVFRQGTQRTRGKIGYPEPFAKFSGLRGQPVWEKLMRYAPIEDIGRCEKTAKLFIIAENEELFDNEEHAILAHRRATGIKRLVSIPKIQHYGIYREARKQAQKLAIDWFDEHLKPKNAPKK